MTDDKLKELEKEEDLQQFISLLKEERNSSEAAILPRTCRPYLKKRQGGHFG